MLLRRSRLAPLLAASALLAIGACDVARVPVGTPSGVSAETAGCTRCHGDVRAPAAIAPAPPWDTKGNVDTASPGVGAHRTHLAGGAIRGGVACSECHAVPSDTAHATQPLDLTWGALARTGNVTPSWNGTALTCANYCHGASLPGGALTMPVWNKVDDTQAACGTCHGVPPPAPHPSVTGGLTACAGCHPGTVKADGSIDVADGKHIDGVVQAGGGASGSTTCTSCHGDANRAAAIAAAPPQGTHGETATTTRAVGAHQAHLVDNTVRAAIACTECHVVPSSTSGHPSGAVNVTFGALATTGGTIPSWNGASCSATYCHGATLSGGAATQPIWTAVDGTQRQCTSCHGAPPPTSSGHPAVTGGVTACAGCHPATVKADGTIDVAGGKHMNGTVEAASGAASCTSCHGDATRSPAGIAPAPPRDTKGNTATTAAGVGAHQAHLQAGPLRGALACADCHTVPSDTAHSTQPLDLTWGALAKSGGVTPSWNGTALTCANYCHGSSLGSGTNHAPVWNTVDGTQAACGTCHGSPPSTGHHSIGNHLSAGCGACHGGTYTSSSADPSLHVNGVKEIGNKITSWNPTTRQCVGCHGSATW